MVYGAFSNASRAQYTQVNASLMPAVSHLREDVPLLNPRTTPVGRQNDTAEVPNAAVYMGNR